MLQKVLSESEVCVKLKQMKLWVLLLHGLQQNREKSVPFLEKKWERIDGALRIPLKTH